jgi:hypothetical protein
MAAAPQDRAHLRRDRTTDQPGGAWLDAVLGGVLLLHAVPASVRINSYLMRWIRKKYKRLRPIPKAAGCWQRVTSQHPRLFAHWAWAWFLVVRMTRAR